jgi:Zn-dependent M16 (insulinase) family peptidase
MEAYLQEFEALHIDSAPPLAERFTAPRAETIAYDPGEDAMKGMQTLNWLLPESGDAEAVLALQILVHILVGTPAAPLRKALIDSGLGEDLAGAGLDVQLREAFFSTGLKGMAVDEQGELKEAPAWRADLGAQTLAKRHQPDGGGFAQYGQFRLRENTALSATCSCAP